MLAGRPVIAGKTGVFIDGGRSLRPSGQEKFFQVKLGIWRCAAHLMLTCGTLCCFLSRSIMDGIEPDCKRGILASFIRHLGTVLKVGESHHPAAQMRFTDSRCTYS
jgi:hypothetical protein